jgi:hypothetical protein
VTDGYVVGVSVSSVVAERENDVRSEPSNQACNPFFQLTSFGVLKHAIAVVPAHGMRHTELLTGRAELLLAHAAQGLAVGNGRGPDLTGLSARRTGDHDLGPYGRVSRERAPRTEGLVVRVGVDTQDARTGHILK